MMGLDGGERDEHPLKIRRRRFNVPKRWAC